MKYYCIGIKGAGMATLANILHDLGNEVSGYDDVKEWKFTQSGLEERHIPIYTDSTHSIDPDTIVTYSKAFSEEHKELKRVKELGLTIKAYNEIIGELTDQFQTISVCGTHGKTTTSSLLKHVIENVYGCNYFIGDGSGYASPKNELFVIESDEFNRHFLTYHPTYTVITNIELEHTECYRDIDDIIQTFSQFANRTKKLIIACGDNENIRKITFQPDVIYYGFSENNDVVIKNLLHTQNGSSFDLYEKDTFYGHYDLPLYGDHMVLNATACIILSRKLDINQNTIHDLLQTFKNAKRRFAEEKVGTNIIIDDYAHHPTEIKMTLLAAKQKYPDRKLIAIFKPNTYSRTEAFYHEFAEALNIADSTYLTEIDCNRETQEEYPGVSSQLILDLLKNGKMIDEETIDQLKDEENAVICMMSCASIEHLKQAYKDLKKEKE